MPCDCTTTYLCNGGSSTNMKFSEPKKNKINSIFREPNPPLHKYAKRYVQANLVFYKKKEVKN